MARFRVLVKARDNVPYDLLLRATFPAMKEGWRERLVRAIEEDGRDMKAISLAAKCGPNYVQQIVTNGKAPGADRLVRLLQVLGRPASLHIILGAELTPEDEALVQAVSTLSPDQKATALAFFQTLPGRPDRPSQ